MAFISKLQKSVNHSSISALEAEKTIPVIIIGTSHELHHFSALLRVDRANLDGFDTDLGYHSSPRDERGFLHKSSLLLVVQQAFQ